MPQLKFLRREWPREAGTGIVQSTSADWWLATFNMELAIGTILCFVETRRSHRATVLTGIVGAKSSLGSSAI
ncbi:hypothetical protein N7535_001401 [Penicillium sp. DV-2018c]|nr:hypothetical protein N7461_005351 [Penicillium sp. DV-2018c]KAJ5582781.1 hypothetical protein N7535_001401 [Penicillium sp. DV-2018c]